MTILETKDLRKVYGSGDTEVRALDGVSLQIDKGEFVAIVGQSGSGKSTLMNVLSGIYPYGSYEGDIIYDGEVCKFSHINDSERKGIVIIHQELALVPYMSIAENMYLGNEKGKKYAFVGKSGCGKSTLIKLIAGYYSDFTGNVLYDADSLSILDIDKITALSSIIHQNVYMFDESIFDNICLHEDYSEKELQSALSDSGLSSFIKQVPNGLEYHVGENGANLSGGQKQRIAVARALIRKKPLLILDEGTSAIDMQTAYDIESRLLAISDLTLLTITHNMSKDILELYDEIIFMADGKIIEHGTFETLIAKHAAFYDFYQLKK